MEPDVSGGESTSKGETADDEDDEPSHGLGDAGVEIVPPALETLALWSLAPIPLYGGA